MVLPKYDADVGREIYDLIQSLFPICRSITGNGVRLTCESLRAYIPIEIFEVSSGTQVFDWTVPKEWNIKDAFIKNAHGERVVDFQVSNLHVVNYSVPINKRLTLNELKPHLHTLPEHPDRIPYVTTYYNERWGFCLTHNQLQALEDGEYDVCIDSTLEAGHLTYGELLIPGQSDEEVLLSTYLCHPSMCNDNLSGVAVLTFLAKILLTCDLKYSYRFLFIPETIGAITWLSQNEDKLSNVKHGLIATCVGDSGKSTYKRSRRGCAEIDRAVEKVLQESDAPYEVLDFFPLGSDERQFCSPGFNLPMGSLMRTPYYQFSEYHTSDDNLDYIGGEFLFDSWEKYLHTVFVLENNGSFVNQNPKCEPQLGRRGLYRSAGGTPVKLNETAILWVLNYSDGQHDLLDIAIRSGLPFEQITDAASILKSKGLLG